MSRSDNAAEFFACKAVLAQFRRVDGKPYRDGFVREAARFDLCNRQPGSPEPTAIGLDQFWEYESTGRLPIQPDRYCDHLLHGKRWWEWGLNEQYAKEYLTDNWVGWYTVALDWWYDPAGFRQIRQRCGAPVCDPVDILNDCLLPGEFFMGTGI